MSFLSEICTFSFIILIFKSLTVETAFLETTQVKYDSSDNIELQKVEEVPERTSERKIEFYIFPSLSFTSKRLID